MQRETAAYLIFLGKLQNLLQIEMHVVLALNVVGQCLFECVRQDAGHHRIILLLNF